MDTIEIAGGLQSEYNRLINLELSIPARGGGGVIMLKKLSDGKTDLVENFIGIYDHNHIMNTMTYDIDFSDDEVRHCRYLLIYSN